MADADPTEPQSEHGENTGAREERQELRRIVDLIPQTIIVLNQKGKAIYANRVALEYTGLSLDEVQARRFSGSRIPSRRCAEASRSRQEEVFPASVPVFGTTSNGLLGKTAKYRWKPIHLIRYSPLQIDENGKVVPLVCNWDRH